MYLRNHSNIGRTQRHDAILVNILSSTGEKRDLATRAFSFNRDCTFLS